MEVRDELEGQKTVSQPFVSKGKIYFDRNLVDTFLSLKLWTVLRW